MKKTDYFQIATKKLKYLNYADSTVKTYGFYIQQFLDSIEVPPTKMKTEHAMKYLECYQFTSISQQNQVINAIKFLYERVLQKKYKSPDFKRPKKEHHLPRVINQTQIKESLAKIRNIKHKAILSLAYSVGLRVSEVINLKIEDIDSNRMLIHIRQSKGRKDRIVPLSENILNLLRSYFKDYQPKTYLFNGQTNLKYSTTSCRKIMTKYISDQHRFHDLRHSCATHLVETNVNLRTIQKILGHKSSKTTEIYTHVSNETLSKVPLPI